MIARGRREQLDPQRLACSEAGRSGYRDAPPHSQSSKRFSQNRTTLD